MEKSFYTLKILVKYKKKYNPKILETGYPCSLNDHNHKIYKNRIFQQKKKLKLLILIILCMSFSSGTTGLLNVITHGHGGSMLQHLKLSLHTNVKQMIKCFF